MNSIKLFSFFLFFSLLYSCKKEQVQPSPLHKDALKNGILVLNEGLMNQNNSSLSWVNLENNEVTQKVFLTKNNRPLGDTGNDMLAYGGKIYIVVTGSSTVEVLQKYSLESLQQISFVYLNQPQQPRNAIGYNGKVFVTSYDGYVSVIDTSSLQITDRIKVGRNPEGLCISNGALYVANSGGLTPSNLDSTVFKIDLNTYKIIDTFDVGKNPGKMVADNFNHVYVVKRGNHTNNPSELVCIYTNKGTVANLGYKATTISARGNSLYLSYYNFSTASSNVAVLDCSSQTLTQPNFIQNQEITTLYGVFPFKNNQLICMDAMNFTNSGYLRFFNSSGKLTKSINVGLNPNSIVYYE